MKDKFTGTGVALITPFTADSKVDFEALERLLTHVADGGVEYLVVLGTTGESATLSQAEKQEVLNFVREKNKGGLPLVAGIGGNDTRAVAREMKEADLDGYQAILSVSPYYNRPTQEGIYRHFRFLSDSSPLPLLLYNVPARTGSNVLPGTVVRLVTEARNIAGIKEASGDMDQIRALLREAPEDFLIISGDDATAVPTALEGGAGVISVLGQGVPRLFSEMIRLALAGKAAEALALQEGLAPLMELIFREGNPAGIKGVLKHLGICEAGMRLPLVPPSELLMRELGDYLRNRLPTLRDVE